MLAEGVFRTIGTLLDAAGVAVIAVGALLATGHLGLRYLRGRERAGAYQAYRQSLGRAVLLGLEFLVAGDIVRTVAVSPTFESLGGLAIIVAIRTFLSVSLEVELDGRWPWQVNRPGT